jgi:hypothetical protein
MALVLSGIGVVRDGGDLGDVAEPLAENNLGCEEDYSTFWSLEKLVCVTDADGILRVFAHLS